MNHYIENDTDYNTQTTFIESDLELTLPVNSFKSNDSSQFEQLQADIQRIVQDINSYAADVCNVTPYFSLVKCAPGMQKYVRDNVLESLGKNKYLILATDYLPTSVYFYYMKRTPNATEFVSSFYNDYR